MGWDGVTRRRVRGLTGAKAGALVSGPEDKCTPRDAPVGRQDTWITDDHGCSQPLGLEKKKVCETLAKL
jgi:hypothetical protein